MLTMYHNRDAIPVPPSPGSPLPLLTLPRNANATNSATIPASNASSIYANPSIQPSSVINLTNSNDVVIGPMTQYQGPVTIYQYMDATVEARANQSNTGIQRNTTSQSSTVLHTVTGNWKAILFFTVLLIAAVGIAVYLTHLNTKGDRGSREILFGNDYESGTIPNLGNGHLVIDRHQWGASENSKLTIPLEHPIPYVVLTHVGVQASPCYNVYKCSIKMRTIQDSSIAEKGLPDITANFYAGDDGNIYVGRGWNYANTYTNKTLAIAFLGDYIRHTPDPKQLEAVQFLISYGIAKDYIAGNYRLVALNQTKTTRSPGTHVYKEIIKWPHFYPCGMNGNPRCGSEIGLPSDWNANQ